MQLNEVRTMARWLMDQHGLHDWSLEFDGSFKRFGLCLRSQKLISLSKRLCEINEEETVRDTVLHEIAHALVNEKGHGPLWVAKAIEIGCNGKARYSPIEVAMPKLPWVSVCKVCGMKVRRTRRSKNRASCGICAPGRFDERFLLTWEKGL